MTEKDTHAVAYLSWRSAWRMRCCPPDDLLYGEKTRELTDHLQFCPWCREERDTDGCKPKFPVLQRVEDCRDKTLPEPGQLWSLKQSLGGWGPKRRYYSPPLVVIIEVMETGVTVCQSYGDMDLAAGDDIPFQTDLTGFIQPWNRYSLRKDDLDTCYGVVFSFSKKEFPSIESINEQSAETGSLFWFFRQMEVETGYFFASQAAPSLLSEYEEVHTETLADILAPFSGAPEKMIRRLSSLGLVFPDPPSSQSSAVDLLFHARAADDILPIAAADSETACDYALSFTLRNEKIIGVKVPGIQITNRRREGPFLHIIGNLTEIDPGNPKIFFRLQTKNIHFDPVPGECGIEKEFFWALFEIEDIDAEEGDFIVRIITDEK